MSDTLTVPIERPENLSDPAPYGGEKGFTKVRGKKVSHKEWLAHLREKKFAKHVHTDGFLAFETEPAYECPNCYFHGFFESDKCHRCGSLL